MGFNNSVNNLFRQQKVVNSAVDYIVLAEDSLINITDTSIPRAVTLPAPSATNIGKFFIVKDTSGAAGTNNITITPASGLVDGAANISVMSNFGSIKVFSDGTNYFSEYVSDPSLGALGWTSYTTNFFSTGTAPTPGAGFSVVSHYLQQGKLLYVKVYFEQTVAGTAGTGRYFYNLPPGFTADLTVNALDPGAANYVDGPIIGGCFGGLRGTGTVHEGFSSLQSSTTYWVSPLMLHAGLGWFNYADFRLHWGVNLSVAIL